MVERDPIYVSPKAGGALKPRDSYFSIENQACSGEVGTPDVIPPQLSIFTRDKRRHGVMIPRANVHRATNKRMQ